MAEYIEREKVKDELLTWAVLIRNPRLMLREDALCVIDSIPAADVVEVVRCKDCKHRVEPTKMCAHPKAIGWDAIEPDDDDFCSCGERRDSDG